MKTLALEVENSWRTEWQSDGVEKKMLKKMRWCVNCVTDILRY